MRIIFIVLLPVFLLGCSRSPYYLSNKIYKQQSKQLAKQLTQQPLMFNSPGTSPNFWAGTTNFNLRKPNVVVIHHTAQNSCEQTLKTFTLTRTQVSAHYVVCKDGTVHHMLNDYLRAWHGGVGKWGTLTDVNSASIGIELDNNGEETFPDAQVNSLLTLLDTLKRRHNIPTQNFIGHADIAPTRKNDPNVHFPWQTLARRGYGLWYHPSTDSLPPTFDHLVALKIIGYDIADSTAALTAFKRKFFAVEQSSPTLSNDEKKALYSLMRQAMK